ncbi:S1 family peptidase [Gordonia crocea]|uniref:Trypsin n=1 Tax=Gordonia crocea TaxID=589162 RepID=A0A7I9UZD8_9ACTN|nr:serine protease [Gordonia crocea]GED98538.1 hypothetical protein nbrc107697_25770 [Gordonia crocea]
MVKTTLKIAAVAAVAAIGIMPAAGPAMADPVSVNDKVSKALVFLNMTITGQVQIPFTSGARWSQDVQTGGTCTGYIVDKTGFIATAGHCVYTGGESMKNQLRQQAIVALAQQQGRDATWATNIYRQAINQSWAVRGSGGDGDRPSVSVRVKQPSGPNQVVREWTTVQVLASQSFMEGDNAVLKMNTPPGELTALPISAVVPKPGEAVTSVGFPGQVRRVSDDMTLPQPSFKTGTVSSRQQNPNGVAQTEVSATIGKGMSGGPTVNANGEVIGTNSMKTVSQEETSEFGFVTDNIALRHYLQGNGATLVSAESGESSGLNMWVWLGPLIGIVALLLLAGLVLGLKRMSNSSPAAQAYPAPQGPGSGVPGATGGQSAPPQNPFGPTPGS